MAEQATQPVMMVNREPALRQYVIVRTSPHGEVIHDHVRLKPGANILQREIYEAIKKEMDFDVRRDVVYQLTKSISALTLSEAVELAKLTADRKVLEVFAATDKRPEVVAIIESKLAAMDASRAAAKAS